jgi:hypothetical protein
LRRPPTEYDLTLRQADQARADFAVIEDGIELIMAQVAKVPKRKELAWVAIGSFCERRRDCHVGQSRLRPLIRNGGSSNAPELVNRRRGVLDTTPPSLLTTAACGGLRPAPDCRPRRALLHLSYSSAPPFGPVMLVTQDPFRTFGSRDAPFPERRFYTTFDDLPSTLGKACRPVHQV